MLGIYEARFIKVYGSSGKWVDEYNFFRDYADIALGAQIAVIIQDRWVVSGIDFTEQNLA